MLLIHLDSQKGFKCTNWQKQTKILIFFASFVRKKKTKQQQKKHNKTKKQTNKQNYSV